MTTSIIPARSLETVYPNQQTPVVLILECLLHMPPLQGILSPLHVPLFRRVCCEIVKR